MVDNEEGYTPEHLRESANYVRERFVKAERHWCLLPRRHWEGPDSLVLSWVEHTTDALDRINELTAELQYLVDYMDKNGLLEEGCFTFPHGDTVWATGKDPHEGTTVEG